MCLLTDYIDCFHEILEERAFRLTSCDNLRDYIPFVQQQEQINGRQVSDGPTHVCEALVIVLMKNGICSSV